MISRPSRSLARDDMRMVERWYHLQPFFCSKPLGFDLRVVLAIADYAQLGTQTADLVHLVGRHQARHADDRAHTVKLCRMRQCPAMIAGRCSHDPLQLSADIELGDRI